MDEEHEQVDGGTPTPEPVVKETRLRRSTKRRMVGGVAGGIAERFDIDANIVRVVFVVLTVLYGLGAAIYLAMWVLIPQSGSPPDDVDESAAGSGGGGAPAPGWAGWDCCGSAAKPPAGAASSNAQSTARYDLIPVMKKSLRANLEQPWSVAFNFNGIVGLCDAAS